MSILSNIKISPAAVREALLQVVQAVPLPMSIKVLSVSVNQDPIGNGMTQTGWKIVVHSEIEIQPKTELEVPKSS